MMGAWKVFAVTGGYYKDAEMTFTLITHFYLEFLSFLVRHNTRLKFTGLNKWHAGYLLATIATCLLLLSAG